jgi:hypothetical protein
MQLMTNELLNPCLFTHLVAWNVQLQNLVILITNYIYNIPYHH